VLLHPQFSPGSPVAGLFDFSDATVVCTQVGATTALVLESSRFCIQMCLCLERSEHIASAPAFDDEDTELHGDEAPAASSPRPRSPITPRDQDGWISVGEVVVSSTLVDTRHTIRCCPQLNLPPESPVTFSTPIGKKKCAFVFESSMYGTYMCIVYSILYVFSHVYVWFILCFSSSQG
jgi:hypothetical protein